MTKLNLTSSYNGNKLYGVGEATLEGEHIHISAEPGTSITLLRDINKVVLLVANDKSSFIDGNVKFGDVYTLENGEKKLIIKVENESIQHETNLFVNDEPVVDATSTKRKTTLSVGILILLLLVTSVIFGIKQKKIKTFEATSQSKLDIAIKEYDLQTRESFVRAKEIAEGLEKSGFKSQKLSDLLVNIKNNESEILGEVYVKTKELLDLTLQINGFSGDKLVSTGETLFVMDNNQKNIIKLDINGKSAKIFAKKDEVGETKEIASYEDRLFTMDDNGIYEIDETKKIVKNEKLSNSLFYLYSANIYLVDRNTNQMFRYSGNNKMFSDRSDWLAPGIEADFSKVIDMTIDGSIWLLSSTGKVTKFTNGNPINITMKGIVSPLKNPVAIYSNEDLKFVYILDKNQGRVVVLEKNGDFKVQYLSDEIKNANDLVVSEKENRVILLTGSKLTYFEIK